MTLRPAPRRVKGRCVDAAAAIAAEMPGTTSHAMRGFGQGFELFFEPAEDTRIAALQAHHEAAFARMLDEQGIDPGLAGAAAFTRAAMRHAAEAALADVDPLRPRRELAQGRIGEGIEEHHIGLAQALGAAQGDEIGLARPGADEDDAAFLRRLHAARAALPRAKSGRGSTTSP